MAKVLKGIAVAAGAVALALAIPGVGTAIGLSAVTALKVGAIAGVISTAASYGAQAFTPRTIASQTDTERIDDDLAEWALSSGCGLPVERHGILDRIWRASRIGLQDFRRFAFSLGGNLQRRGNIA